MTEPKLFSYAYAPSTNAQLRLLEVAPNFYELYILDPIGTSWATIGSDRRVEDAVVQLKDAGLLQTVMSAENRATVASSRLCAHNGPARRRIAGRLVQRQGNRK